MRPKEEKTKIFLGVPLGILGSGFRHGIHKATTPKASACAQPSKGGGFAADGECLYPSRSATRGCFAVK